MIIPIVLAFVSVTLFSLALLQLGFSEERQVKRVVKGLSEYVVVQAREAEPLIQPFQDRILKPVLRWLLVRAQRVTPHGVSETLRRQLATAGSRRLKAEELLVVKFFAAVAGAVLSAVVAVLWTLPLRGGLFMALLGAILGFFIPDAWLSHAVAKRKLLIQRALPDMLDMLTISVEAGLGFDSALAKLVAKSSGPLAEEFALALQEVQAGMSRRDALRNLAERTDVPDLRTFVTSILQAEVLGIGINSILRSQGREMRVRRRQHAEEVAQKAPVKMVFPVVLCIFPATLLVIAGPAVIAIARAFGFILGGG